MKVLIQKRENIAVSCPSNSEIQLGIKGPFLAKFQNRSLEMIFVAFGSIL